MRRAVLLAAALLVLTAPAALAQEDQDCKDFATQADAQAHLDADPSDPDNLDADSDGKACEQYPYQAAEGDSQPTEGETLPRTGAGIAGLPVALALLSVGSLLLAHARYRPRH